jgi:HK97 family phage portal protein
LLLDSRWDLSSPGLEDYAISKGFTRPGRKTDLAADFSDLIYTTFADGRRRCDRSRDLLSQSGGEIAVQDLAAILRDHRDKKDPQRGFNEVIQIKNYFPGSSYYGLPDYIPALSAMSLDKNAIIFNNAFFANGGMIGQLMQIKNATLTPEQKTELRRFIQYNFTGVDNAHRMAILDALPGNSEIKIEKIMETVKDMSFERLRRYNRDEIIASHRVPPKMLNVSEPGRLGESKDGHNQMKMFKRFEIDPSQRRIENSLNRLFFLELGITSWKIKFKPLDIRDPKDESEELWGDVDRGIRTVDEAREERGLEPLNEEPAPPAIKKSGADDLEVVIESLEKYHKKLINSLEGL